MATIPTFQNGNYDQISDNPYCPSKGNLMDQ